MNRRTMMKTTAASMLMSGLPLTGQPVFAADPVTPASAQDTNLSPLSIAARNAWIYGLALIENAKSRADVLKRGKPNTVVHEGKLVDASWRDVTTPNNDTLYSRSWINLTEGPVEIQVPKGGDRYVSVALMDMYMNNFAILGTRTTGNDGGTYKLVGPKDPIEDAFTIRAPTPWVWSTLRVLVNGPQDLDTARSIQNKFKVTGPAADFPPEYAERSAPWQEFLTSVQKLVLENPPPVTDERYFETMSPLGLSMSGGFDPSRFDETQSAEIDAGFLAAKKWLRSAGRPGPVINNWSYPKATLGDFGDDFLYRAQVAIAGLGALPMVEAMYLRPVSDSGNPNFDSNKVWRLILPGSALPPVDAFWSLSMYEQTPEGQYFFVDNPLDRYVIGDRSPDLVRMEDGGIDIWMSRTPPPANIQTNWLPTPAERPFSVFFRGYLPKDEFMSWEYKMPKLTEVVG